MTEKLKIQYGDVYIQIPTDNLEQIVLVRDFLESVIKKFFKQNVSLESTKNE